MASENPEMDGQENTAETQEAVLVENRRAEWPAHVVAEIREQMEERDTVRPEAEGAGESNAESDEQETSDEFKATEDVGDATPGDEAEQPETGTELAGELSPEMFSDDAFPAAAQGSTIAISAFTEVTEETPAGEPAAEAGAFAEEVTFATEVEHFPNAEEVEANGMEADAAEQAVSTTATPENAFEEVAAESSDEAFEEGTESGDEATEEDLVAQAPGEVGAEGDMVVEAAEVTEETPAAEEGEASNTGAEEAGAEAEAEGALAAEEQAEGEAEAETLLEEAAEVFQEALSEIRGAVESEEEARAEAEAGAAPEAIAEIEAEAAVEIEEATEALTEAEVLVEAAVEVIAEVEAATEGSAVVDEAIAEAQAEEAAEEAETEAEGGEEAVEEPVLVASSGQPTRRLTSALILDQVLVAEAEGAAREPVTFVAHKFIAIGPNREPRVLVYHYHGRTGQPLHNVPVLLEASRAAHFFHQKATSGQTDGREVLVRIPEEHIILIMAGDGDVISVNEEVARVIFPVIAQQRAFWAAEQRDTPAPLHEAPPALSFDDWE